MVVFAHSSAVINPITSERPTYIGEAKHRFNRIFLIVNVLEEFVVLVPHLIMVIFTATFDNLATLQFEEHSLLWWKLHCEEHFEESNCIEDIDNVHFLVVTVLSILDQFIQSF